jgi:hypothetical protein
MDLLPVLVSALPVYLDTWEELNLSKEGVVALKNAKKMGEKCSLNVLEQLLTRTEIGVLLLKDFNKLA